MNETDKARGWRAEAQFRADQRVTTAIDVLRGITAADLRQHLADGETLARDMTPERRAQWEAQLDAPRRNSGGRAPTMHGATSARQRRDP